jgi:hypothetical protein
LNSWYRHADVFVYTSVSETFGNVVNEALWCGTPVVGLDDGMGVAHQLRDGINGYLLDPSRPDVEEVFGERCLRLCGQDVLRKTLGRKAAELCIETSHPDNVVAHFERIYERAIEHCRRTVPKPMAKRSRLRQMMSLSQRLSRWSWYTWLLLAISHITTKFGTKRTEGLPVGLPVTASFEKQVAASLDPQVEAQWRAGA